MSIYELVAGLDGYAEAHGAPPDGRHPKIRLSDEDVADLRAFAATMPDTIQVPVPA